jgi:hypothetical protein
MADGKVGLGVSDHGRWTLQSPYLAPDLGLGILDLLGRDFAVLN